MKQVSSEIMIRCEGLAGESKSGMFVGDTLYCAAIPPRVFEVRLTYRAAQLTRLARWG